MGRVFSYNDLKDGKVPQLKSFSLVIDRVRCRLESTSGMIGGIFLGSTIYNPHFRSDIDVVFVYDDDKRKEVFEVLRHLYAFSKTLFVPLDFVPVSRNIASTSLHTIEFGFMSHLKIASEKGGGFGQDILPLISVIGNPFDNIASYVQHKIGYMEERAIELSSMKVVEEVRFLQKILELPVHVARKVLMYRGVKLEDDSKRTVMARYPRIVTSAERKTFQDLIRLDNWYTQQLSLQVKEFNQQKYFDVLEDVRNGVWTAIEFLHLTAQQLI